MNNRVDLLLIHPGLVYQFVVDNPHLFYILRARWPSAMNSFADPPARIDETHNRKSPTSRRGARLLAAVNCAVAQTCPNNEESRDDGISGALSDGTPKGGVYVSCAGIWKAYGGREVLRGINLSVNRGEVVAIMGPSGSGKSTLLRLINHLEQLDKGEILVSGERVGYRLVDGVLRPSRDLAARAKARIGMVFQHFNLFDHLTALENVIEAPIRVYGEDPERARAKAMGLLTMVGPR